MSCCDPELWLLDLELLQNYVCHVYKFCTKFEWNIHGQVVDSLAYFRRAILGAGGIISQECMDSTSTNSARTQGDHDYTRSLFQSLFQRYTNAGGKKLAWYWKWCQISHIWLPANIRGGVGEIYIPIIEALPTTEPTEYIRWPSTVRLLNTVDW